jgi:hypothetical protein
MPVVIASKSRFHGYLDLRNLATNDALEVREYIAVDGVNYRILYRYSFSGLQSEPILRLHAKTLLYNMRYKVTVVQTAGSTLKSIPYGFIVEVMGAT